MKKKTPPRLTLKRETLRHLEQLTLHMVVGGASSKPPTNSDDIACCGGSMGGTVCK